MIIRRRTVRIEIEQQTLHLDRSLASAPPTSAGDSANSVIHATPVLEPQTDTPAYTARLLPSGDPK